MSTALAIPLFLVSLVVTLAAAASFARRLDRLGVRLRIPEAFLGVLTALAADGPEITSALVALGKGAKGASFGVLVGSNLFNLAAMLGLSAVLAGSVHLRRGALAVEGTVGVLALLIASALLLGALPAAAAAGLLGAVLVPYFFIIVRRPHVSGHVDWALAEREHTHRTPPATDEHPVWRVAMLLPPAVALIILGSVGMVEAALALGDRWHVSRLVVGLLVLAPATSLPNAFTAVRLGLADRGAAVVSETLNSNTINLAVGIVVPALVVSLAVTSTRTKLDLGWLLVMTLVCLLLLAQRRGMGRAGGAAVIALYVAFVGVSLSTR